MHFHEMKFQKKLFPKKMFPITCSELGKNLTRKGLEKRSSNHRIIWTLCGEEINAFCFWVTKVDTRGKNPHLRSLITLETTVFTDQFSDDVWEWNVFFTKSWKSYGIIKDSTNFGQINKRKHFLWLNFVEN